MGTVQARPRRPVPAPVQTSQPAIETPEKTPKPSTWGSLNQKHYFVCLLVVLSTVAVYLRTVHFTFADFDDSFYVLENAPVKAGLTWKTIQWSLTTRYNGNWHPITWLSHAADCQFFGLTPGGPHAVNLAWHVINVALVFWVFAAATGAPWRSLLVAALFALHPFNVESVAWISERKNLLCTFFFLLSLAAYGRYTRHPGTRRYLLVAGLFALGLAAKPMIITFPLLLLLVDFWPLQRVEDWHGLSISASRGAPKLSIPELLWEKVPLFILSAASAVITVIAQSAAGAVDPLHVLPLNLRLQNAVYSCAKYVWITFWPSKLAVFYPHPGPDLGIANLILAAAFLISVSVWVWRLRISQPYLITGWLWFLVSLLPVIGIVQVGGQARADRYMYLPALGLFTMIVLGGTALFDHWRVSVSWRASLAVAALAILAALTWRQLDYWRDPYAMWNHTLEVTQNNPTAEHNLAVLLLTDGRMDEALPHLEKAVRLDPKDANAIINIGADHADHGRIPQAIEFYNEAIRVSVDKSTTITALGDLGGLYHKIGNQSEARNCFERVLQLDPTQTTAKLALGMIYLEEANPALASVVTALPTYQGYVQMGESLRKAGKVREAQAAYEKAKSLQPIDAGATDTQKHDGAAQPSYPTSSVIH